MRSRIAILGFIFLNCLTAQRGSNTWRGITPLHSTCDDVKKVLKVDICKVPISQYELPDFRVMVEFKNETCKSEPRAWRVPKGTVVAVILHPRNEMLPSEFDLDLSKFRKRDGGDLVGMEKYDAEEEGVTVELYQGYVNALILSPRKADQNMRCQPAKY